MSLVTPARGRVARLAERDCVFEVFRAAPLERFGEEVYPRDGL